MSMMTLKNTMREIKFRAWDKEKGIFLKDDSFLISPQYGGVIPWLDNNSTGFALKDIEIMQYTGLKDKNSKEIYEGDIVKGIYEVVQSNGELGGDLKMCGQVFYDHSCFSLECVQSMCDKDRYGMVNYFNFISDDGEIFSEKEIIGNIYENKELLL